MTEQQKTKIITLKRGDREVLLGHMEVFKPLAEPEIVSRGKHKGEVRTEKLTPVTGMVIGKIRGREVVASNGRVIHVRGDDKTRPLPDGDAGTDGGTAILVSPDTVIIPGLNNAILRQTVDSKKERGSGKPRRFFGKVNNGRTKIMFTEWHAEVDGDE